MGKGFNASGWQGEFGISAPSLACGHYAAAASAFCKAPMLRQGSGITRTMQDANDHKLLFIVQIVDGVIARKTYAQSGREVVARGRGERKITQRLAILFDPVDEARCSGLGGFDGNVEPDFS